MREKEDRLLALLGQLPDEMLREAMTPSMVTDEVTKTAPEEVKQGTAPKAKWPVLWHKPGKRGSLLAACLLAVLLCAVIWDPAGWSLFGDKQDATETEPPLTEASATEAAVSEGKPTDAVLTETAAGTLATAQEEIFEFWYRGIRYRFTGRVLTELPENAEPVSLLYRAESQSTEPEGTRPEDTAPLGDWQTSCDALAGCQVYRILYRSDLLVEHEDGYGYYMAYAEIDRKGETEDEEKP